MSLPVVGKATLAYQRRLRLPWSRPLLFERLLELRSGLSAVDPFEIGAPHGPDHPGRAAQCE